MKDKIETLGRITDVFFGIEDHGIMTLSVDMEFDFYHQGFGGYYFDEYVSDSKQRKGNGKGIEFIRRLLEVCNVNEISKLKGRMLYAIQYENKGPIVGVRSSKILNNKDDTFMFSSVMERDDD